MTDKFWEKTLIYKVKAGSHAYGLNTTKSDLDIRGVCIEPPEYLLGLKSFEQYENKNPAHNEDTVIYGLKKFIKLALQCNPNIIEILFVNPEDILFINDYGKDLLAIRNIFVSKASRFRFAGYAFAQLERIKRHKRWIDNPPLKPSQKDYVRNTSIQTYDGERIHFRKFFEHEYDKALKEYNHYLEWMKNRNPERAELERKYGLDCKHAKHLYRLLKMGCEILEGKGVIVKRPDRELLLEIANGKYTYKEVMEYATKMEKKLDALYVTSKLPHSPDFNEANKFIMDIYQRYWDKSQLPRSNSCGLKSEELATLSRKD